MGVGWGGGHAWSDGGYDGVACGWPLMQNKLVLGLGAMMSAERGREIL